MFANALSNCQESTEITGACSLARHIQNRSQRALGVCQEICMIAVDIKVAASDRRYAVLFESLFQLEDPSYWTERQYFCLKVNKMLKFHILLVVLVFVPSRLDAACPNEWKEYEDICYKRFPANSWSNAKKACEAIEAKLAEPIGDEQNKFLNDTFEGNDWLGYTRCHRNSTCRLDFSNAAWTNWAAGQPDKSPQYPPGQRNKDFAVVIRGDGKWIDQPKQEKRRYICEKPEDLCFGNFCNPKGSTCVDGKCVCKPPHYGEYCYGLPCDKKPCENGGTCKNVPEGYTCTCINHYAGKNCSEPPPCKINDPCINGVCEDISNVQYKCKCNMGWIGTTCAERPCDRNPCPKAKKCVNKGFTHECVCERGWTGNNCEKEGVTNGDPHYRTFDGRHYNFQGKCEYIFAKDCSEDHAFEVLQQNEACARPGSCTKSLKIITQQMEIRMERGGIVYVDGIRVPLPWRASTPTTPSNLEVREAKPQTTGEVTTITGYRSGAFLQVPALLFSVRWNGYMDVNVKINQRYRNKTCGLLGNADSNVNNDYRLRDGTVTQNVAEFGNSWKTNPHCVNGKIPPDPCTMLSRQEYIKIQQKCARMRQPPFSQCNERVNSDNGHITDCEYDVCAMHDSNPSGAWCQAMETYDEACTALGVKVDWEGKPGFEECGNPCANIPCFNGAVCRNTNRTAYECVCPTGFSGPTCQNVDCRPGYTGRGNLCYKLMGRRPWPVAKCRQGDQFVSAEDEDENRFIYEKFVERSRKPLWMHARVCAGGKLCHQDYGPVFYNNVDGDLPKTGCVQMPFGKGMKWVVKNCRAAAAYVCKYEKF